MNYEEWLAAIDELSRTNNKEKLELLKRQEYKANIADILEPKIENLVIVKLNMVVRKIIRDLEQIFKDVNYLDLALVNLKKEVNFIIDIVNLKQVGNDLRNRLMKRLKEETDKVYDILIKEANRTDQSGLLAMTIKNNRIKWGE